VTREKLVFRVGRGFIPGINVVILVAFRPIILLDLYTAEARTYPPVPSALSFFRSPVKPSSAQTFYGTAEAEAVPFVRQSPHLLRSVKASCAVQIGRRKNLIWTSPKFSRQNLTWTGVRYIDLTLGFCLDPHQRTLIEKKQGAQP
jgi:hypothetical protein